MDTSSKFVYEYKKQPVDFQVVFNKPKCQPNALKIKTHFF